MIWICANCAVETTDAAEPPQRCEICEDEREWVPADGQRWTTLAELRAAGTRTDTFEVEPNLLGIRTEPDVGIGQQTMVIRTPAGAVVFDPTGYVDEQALEEVRGLGAPLAIAVSHPHMCGVMSVWAEKLGVPVLACALDRDWVRRTDHVEWYVDRHEITEGLILHRVGGHFPGSAVLEWRAGADGRGVLFAGDAIFPNPDRRTVSFLRSYPNRLPLSGNVVLRIADFVQQLAIDRLYNNFGDVVETDAKNVVTASARRHAAWCRGDYDHLTW